MRTRCSTTPTTARHVSFHLSREVLIRSFFVRYEQLYDQHGVWPPPAPEPQYARPGPSFSQDPFANDPFFSRMNGGMNGGRRQYAFTDPFELFNSLFGDFHRAFENDPFFADAFPSRGPGFARSPFGSMFPPSRGNTFDSAFFRDPFGGSPFGPFGGPMMGGPMITDGNFGGQSRTYSSSSSSFGQGGQWVSQSQMTRTINGRTETIIKRRDAEVCSSILLSACSVLILEYRGTSTSRQYLLKVRDTLSTV